MNSDYYKITDIKYELPDSTDEEYNLAKNFKINQTKTTTDIGLKTRTLISSLTSYKSENIKVIENVKINANKAGILNNIITITPSTIELNTTTTHQETFTFQVTSSLELITAICYSGSYNLSQASNIKSGRASANISSLTFTYQDENGNYNYELVISIYVAEGYEYQVGRVKEPRINLFFIPYIIMGISSLSYMPTKDIKITLITE